MRKLSGRIKPDPAWIRARQALLKQIKSEVALRLGPEPEDLREYRKRYERELKKPWTASSKAELIAEIDRSDIVYGGDFHALGQSQRTHLKILRAISDERKVILGLECFARPSQKWLDLFLNGAISIEELKRKAKWSDGWGFPWENYRPLLEIAKRRGFQLLALNDPHGARSHDSLEAREANSAKAIADAYARAPNALIYVIFGDLHLASSHLPKIVRAALPRRASIRELVVHLNSEKIYFQLAQSGLELTVDVVRLGANCFCVLGSPPWVQWQSYLLFLERTDDSDLDRGANGDGSDEGEDFDPTDQVAALIKLAGRDLGLTFKLDDFSVYSSDDNLIWQSLEKNLKPAERTIARQLLASGRSFFLPNSSSGYLAQATVNHAAAMAGQYIHASLSGRKSALWSMPRDFPALIWTEAVAYFISKLINHKRQSETLTDLRGQLAVSGEADKGREAMRLALDRFMTELLLVQQGRRRAPQVRPRQKSSYFEASRILGGMLGERLYMAHRSRKLSQKEVVQLLKRDVTARAFAKDYEEILRLLANVAAPISRTKRERL